MKGSTATKESKTLLFFLLSYRAENVILAAITNAAVLSNSGEEEAARVYRLNVNPHCKRNKIETDSFYSQPNALAVCKCRNNKIEKQKKEREDARTICENSFKRLFEIVTILAASVYVRRCNQRGNRRRGNSKIYK